ncbi:GNAT family N-acetyltransferase [Georgenia sp. TF02-10]|uniref:GNAT family N-acetyltransferase n=1 Tax=Georgenia sp. TF02-10 TaxID=2917725 RepID=UPI001FA7C8D1|nr:GNAT family N-acetyltransferase [Georgenia sp. TF02-10]UNX55926.1 GNAT family N-acetyltransferase [Georgenia sp. TF02-10]
MTPDQDPTADGARDLPADDVLGRLLAGEPVPDEPPGAHAGHAHADDAHRPAADVSVRPALPEDAAALGDVHARTMRASLAAGLGTELPATVRSALDPAVLAAAWGQAITDPPGPGYRVLTALAGAEVVGFAAIAPAEEEVEVAPAPPELDPVERPAEPARADRGTPEADGRAEDGQGQADAGRGQAGADRGQAEAEEPTSAGAVGEILALEVPAAHGRRGHGSRLLAACADLLREQGVTRVQAWAVQGDESRSRFLAQAGFAPAGVRRVVDVAGGEVVEVCWFAHL